MVKQLNVHNLNGENTMRTQFSKFALTAAFGLALSFSLSCSSDSGSPPKKTVKKEKISGVSQKGSFVRGSTVKLYELNENYGRTGKVFNGEIKDDNGRYEIEEIKDYELVSPYVEVEATGRYINEILPIWSMIRFWIWLKMVFPLRRQKAKLLEKFWKN